MDYLLALLLAACAGLLAYLVRLARWGNRERIGASAHLRALRADRAAAEGRAYLARLLELDADRLPPMGGWAASADFLILIAEDILARRPALVVEFGSGLTTLVAARALALAGGGRLLSFEHDAAFAEATRRRAGRLSLATDIRVTPLVSAGSHEPWYATGPLPDGIGLAIVDGPPKAVGAQARGAAFPALAEHLSADARVLLDDAHRPGERAVARRWASAFPQWRFDVIDTDKGALIARRRAPPEPAASATAPRQPRAVAAAA